MPSLQPIPNVPGHHNPNTTSNSSFSLQGEISREYFAISNNELLHLQAKSSGSHLRTVDEYIKSDAFDSAQSAVEAVSDEDDLMDDIEKAGLFRHDQIQL